MKRLSTHYLMIVKLDFISKFNYKNVHKIPGITKIVLNFGIKDSKRALQAKICLALEILTGQKVLPLKAKKSIASLKIAKNKIVGCKVTLRGEALFSFLDKLVLIVFPQLPSDNVVLKSPLYNNHRVLSFKIPAVNLFPELDYKFHNLQNLDINIVTSANTNEELLLLLTALQFPKMNNLQK
jgi:large subunit ribosomal protein L5